MLHFSIGPNERNHDNERIKLCEFLCEMSNYLFFSGCQSPSIFLIILTFLKRSFVVFGVGNGTFVHFEPVSCRQEILVALWWGQSLRKQDTQPHLQLSHSSGVYNVNAQNGIRYRLQLNLLCYFIFTRSRLYSA